jgi:hypothetical protein
LALWVFLSSFVLIAFGIRSDYEQLGWEATWGLALVQVLIAYVLTSTGLRLTIPGSNLSLTPLLLLMVLALGVQLGTFIVTGALSPVAAEMGQGTRLAFVCFFMTGCLALLPLGVVSALSVKGLPQRAVVIGLLCGLGGALSAEAAWRLHCPYSNWEHLLSAHFGGVLAISFLGAGLGYFWLSRRV